MDVPRVLVLDSGIGGLSVASQIRRRIPAARLYYLADTDYYPYGLKTERELINRVTLLIAWILRQHSINIVVVACNTASTVVLDALRSRFNMPFVGVVPAVKPAALLSKSGIVGVLATKGTVNRQYTANLIRNFASNCDVFLYGSQLLVDMAEHKLQGHVIDQSVINQEMQCLTGQAGQSGMDTVVLACTHFPLLIPELKLAAPHIRHWVDSGEAIARRVEYWIACLGLNCSFPNQQNDFIVTKKAFLYDNKAIQHLLGDHESSSPNIPVIRS